MRNEGVLDKNTVVSRMEFERRLQLIKRSGHTGFILLSGSLEDEKMMNDQAAKFIRRIDNMVKVDEGKILLMITNLQGANNVSEVIDRLSSNLSGNGVITTGIYLPYAVLDTEQVVKLLSGIDAGKVVEYPNPFCILEKGVECFLGDSNNRCHMLEEFNKFISMEVTKEVRMTGTIGRKS